MIRAALIMGLLAGAATAAPGEPDLHFAPQGLYGHINGGAELFLEFGFTGLDVYHATDDLDVEVYRMADPAAALGIYLAKCGDETPWPEVPARNTASAYQLTAVRGSLFVQVNNFGGDPAARPAMVDLARTHLEAEPEAAPLAIWDELPADGRVPGSTFLLRGRFTLDPIYTFGAGDVLQLETSGALGAGARYARGDETIKRLVIAYPDADAAAAALDHVTANLDSYLTPVRSSDGELVFRDWEELYGHLRRDGALLRVGLHLPAPPEG